VNLFLPMFGVGLVTSIHCVAMCGSMVLTYAVKGDQSGPLLGRMTPHFAYHAAKLTSYMLVGLLLGLIGSAFDLGGVRGWVTIGAGVFMVALGLNMTGKFPALRALSFRPPRFLMTLLSRTRKRAVSDANAGRSSIATPITFGLITGLMPCGPLQSAQLAAAATGTPVAGAIAMLGFGLGTMPLMLGFGAVSGALGAKFKQRMLVVAAVLVMVLGLVMVNRGAMLVGSPVTANTIKQAFVGAPAPVQSAEAYTTGADGVVEVPLVIENVRFQPQALSIPADKPVRLLVDRREENACSAQIAVPQLGVLVNLAPNAITAVDIPASPAGSYTLTCGMGMMAGTLQVGAGAAARAATVPPLAVPALLGLAALAGWQIIRRRKAVPEPAAPAAKKRGSHPAPVPVRSGAFLGLEPVEVILAGAVVLAAAILGLGFGGYFG